MEKEFVPYKESICLKEIGFNENVFSFYKDEQDYFILEEPCNRCINVTDHPYYGVKEKEYIPRPLYQQVFRWFREKYSLVGFISNDKKYNHWWITIQVKDADSFDKTGFITYEEAELACLKKLIEIVKNKK